MSRRAPGWLTLAAVLVAFALGLLTGGLVGGGDEAPCGDVRGSYEERIRSAADAPVDEGRVHVAEAHAIATERSDCFTDDELRSLPRPPPT